jgi:hypothetical protein
MSNLQRRTNDCYGIECWLRSQGLKVTTKTVSEITASFLKSKGLPYTKFYPRYVEYKKSVGIKSTYLSATNK